MERKVAIFHWGEITIHAYYLAEELCKQGISVDFFLYTPTYANKLPHLKKLIVKLEQKTNLIEIKCTYFETYLIKIHRLIGMVGPYLPSIFTNPFLPYRTRKKYKSEDYNYVITIAQTSLYWLFKTDPDSLNKTLHYSLEIEKISDPNLKNRHLQHAIINKETKLLKHIHGLIIQDKLRAESLVDNAHLISKIKFLYFPVSIPGNIVETQSNYLHSKFNIASEKKIILYFGAVFQERKIDELVNSFEMNCNDQFVLIVHGPGDFSHISNSAKIKISNQLLDYEDLHLIISSASIGLAFYDIDWPNTRLTAFASEKIARYTQAGVPFIAFKNESYINLKNEFDCCELIDDINELSGALDNIMNNYHKYRVNSFNAYNKYYKIERSIKPIVSYIAPKRLSYQFDIAVS